MQTILTPALNKQLINRQIVLADKEREKHAEGERKNNNVLLHNKHIRRFVALSQHKSPLLSNSFIHIAHFELIHFMLA